MHHETRLREIMHLQNERGLVSAKTKDPVVLQIFRGMPLAKLLDIVRVTQMTE